MGKKVCPTCKDKVFIINPDFVKWQKANPKLAVGNFRFPQHIMCPDCSMNKIVHPKHIVVPDAKPKEEKKK